jgi:hypothetical protein
VDPSIAPIDMEAIEWMKLDRKEKSIIWLCVLYPTLLNVSGEATIKYLWGKLGTLY